MLPALQTKNARSLLKDRALDVWQEKPCVWTGGPDSSDGGDDEPGLPEKFRTCREGRYFTTL